MPPALTQTSDSSGAASAPTPAAPPSELLPLSFAQEQLWFLDQLAPGQATYNVPLALRLRGKLSVPALEAALSKIIERHEILRTIYVSENGSPRQAVQPPQPFRVSLAEISARDVESSRWHESLAQFARQPFDLQHDLMIRAALFRLGVEDHILLLSLHHIAADQWSLQSLFQEMAALYAAALANAPLELEELPIQYADYALWQRERFQEEPLRRQIAYWKARLQGRPSVTELPADHPRNKSFANPGGAEELVLPPALRARLEQFSRERGVTPFITLLAVFNTLIHRHAGQDDILIGSPVAGRLQPETEQLIGFFVNTLILRSKSDDNPDFLAFLNRTRSRFLEALDHQEAPFEKIVEELHPDRASSQVPLLSMLFAVEDSGGEKWEMPGLEVSPVHVHTGTAKFDLTCVAKVSPERLSLFAEYDATLFEPATIRRFLERFQIALQHVLAHPETPLAQIPMLTAEERRLLLETPNTTDYPRNATVSSLFEEQAAARPAAAAVRYGIRSLTYGQLDARANQLARHLQRSGCGAGTLVAVSLDRSPELIVSLLAVLKAGAAYVPLDPSYPPERLAAMMQDTQAPLIVTSSARLADLASLPGQKICLDAAGCQPADGAATKESFTDGSPTERFPCPASSGDAAYVIYTSGSTGQPKGAVVPHRAIVRLVRNTDYVSLGPDAVIAQASNASFDAATFEIWGALLNGGCLVGVETQTLLSPSAFAQQLQQDKITTLFLTTALFNQFAREKPDIFQSLRNVLFGGEAVDPQPVRMVLKSRPPQRLLHVYGPTENTTFSTWFEVREVETGAVTIPIGHSIANSQSRVLDRHLQPVPLGVAGELFVGGDGLAAGYLRRPELTAEKFVPNPLGTGSERLYRTGDLVRQRSDGAIEFLGRIDHQVKIRGFRVEPGEIEAVALRHPALRHCVVTAHTDSSGAKRLAAYLVWQAGEQLEALRDHLKVSLPDYMIPSAFMTLESLPLNANGKVDRKALPAPPSERKASAAPSRPPTPTEQKLIAIWEDILDTRPVSLTDDFFELGGHSLLAVRLFSRIDEAFQRKIPLATLFQHRTVADLARVLETPETPGARSLIVPIQTSGAMPPFFWIHSLGGDGGGGFFYYRKLAQLLGEDQPSYGIRSPNEPFTDIREMAGHYVDELIAFQPKGPHYLGGFCFGGNVAFEMARQLMERGREVALLVMLESAAPLASTRNRWSSATPEHFKQWLQNLMQQSPSELRHRIQHKFAAAQSKLMRKLRPAPEKAEAGGTNLSEVMDLSHYPKDYLKYAEAHWQAMLRYAPQLYSGRITLFRSRKQPLMRFDPTLGWGDFARGGLTVNIIPGTHEEMLEEPNVHILATELKALLAEAHVRALDQKPAA